MLIHRANCKYGYNTTDECYEPDDIIGVFGSKESRWFKIKWAGYPESEWERENLLLRDGYQDEIRDFWVRTGLQPNKEFHPDPDDCHRHTVCGRSFKRSQDLKVLGSTLNQDTDLNQNRHFLRQKLTEIRFWFNLGK